MFILLLSFSCFGALDVFIQDQTTPPLDLFFSQGIGAPTTITVNASINDTSITIADTTNFIDGIYVGIFKPAENRFYFGTQIGAPVVNTISLDTPLDFAFEVGDTVVAATRNLNVDGSVTPQIFSVRGVGTTANASIDITRIMISFVTDGAVDLNKFGDLASLDYGIVLRRVDGDIRNIWNVKNNGDIANLCYDYAPFVASNPAQGQNGAKFRYSFAGQDKHGVAVRLNPGDELQLLIQDDLTDLTQFRIVAEGHVVDDINNDEVSINMAEMILLIVFIIGILLAWLGYYVKNVYLITLSALWFVMSGVTTFLAQGDILGIPAWAQTIFFIGVGGVLAVNAWFFYDRNKYKTNNNYT